MNDYPTLVLAAGPTRTERLAGRRRQRRATRVFAMLVLAAAVVSLYVGGAHIRRIQVAPACVAAQTCHCRYPPRRPHRPLRAGGNQLCPHLWPSLQVSPVPLRQVK
jgi:hypothetical protein